MSHSDRVSGGGADGPYVLAKGIADATAGSTLRCSDASGSGASDDPRLRAQLDILRARRLSQFSLAINGVRLNFWGEEPGSIPREIYIEHPTIGIARGGEPTVVYAWNDPAVTTSLLSALGGPVSAVGVDGGRLSITFSNGVSLSVEPDEQYESWQINSEDGLLFVCTPGGELTVWYPPDA